jgi:hypothetical protein
MGSGGSMGDKWGFWQDGPTEGLLREARIACRWARNKGSGGRGDYAGRSEERGRGPVIACSWQMRSARHSGRMGTVESNGCRSALASASRRLRRDEELDLVRAPGVRRQA